MKLLIILSSLLISCVSDEIGCDKEPDAIIENICIYKNQFQEIDNYDLRKAINIIDVVWSEKFDVDVFDISDRYKDPDFNTQIEFVRESEYKGVTKSGTYIVLLIQESDKKCIANTAIGHEVLHVLGGSYGIDYGDHANSDLFMVFADITDRSKNSLENIINLKMCSEFCEEDCLRYRIK